MIRHRPTLVEHQSADVRGQSCGAKGHDAAVRMTIDVHLFPGCRGHRIHHDRNVFVLPFQPVLRTIAEGTSASWVECMNLDVSL